MTKLPPFIMTSEVGSFARKTIEQLKPGIIDNILSEYDYTPHIRKSLQNLKAEMANGTIQKLYEQTSDRSLWDEDFELVRGKSWLEIPWFFAETYFFRRILEAVQYFQPGPWQGRDPFEHLKNEEISKGLEAFIETYHSAPEKNEFDNFKKTCYQALWGNQSDLSNLEIYDSGVGAPSERFILDQSKDAYAFLSNHPGKIAYFFDNVGKELYFDLAFVDYLLSENIAKSVTCYLKNQPFFVTDALPCDLQKTIDMLASSASPKCKNLAERLINRLKAGNIIIKAPPFFATSRMYRELPDGLKKQIKTHKITILKGDVNFRRLVGDRHWDPTTPINKAGGYFPSPFLSLRTLKSELILGITKERFQSLQNQSEKDWLINGKRGVILFHKK
jgi:hypothetical protein